MWLLPLASSSLAGCDIPKTWTEEEVRDLARQEVGGSGIISYSTREISDLQDENAALRQRVTELENDERDHRREIVRLGRQVSAMERDLEVLADR